MAQVDHSIFNESSSLDYRPSHKGWPGEVLTDAIVDARERTQLRWMEWNLRALAGRNDCFHGGPC